jgi:hypothetical protein
VADEDSRQDELAEPGFGDGEVEEDGGCVGRGVEGAFEGVFGLGLLLVDELAADVVLFGQARDTATPAEGIQAWISQGHFGVTVGRRQAARAG